MPLTKPAQHQGRGLHKDDPERKEIKKALMRGDYGPKMTATEIRLSKPRYKRKFTGGKTFAKSISRLRQEIKEETKKTKKTKQPNSKNASFKTSPKIRGLRLEDPERNVIKQALKRGDFDPNTTADEIRHSNLKWQAKFSQTNFARSITLLRQEIAFEKSKVATPHKQAQVSSSKSKSVARENKKVATKTPPKKARVSSPKSRTSTSLKGRSSTRRVALFKAAGQPRIQSARSSAVPTRISRRLASKAPLRIALPKSSRRSITAVKAKATAATAPSVTAVNVTTDQEPRHLLEKRNHLPISEQLSHSAAAQLSLPVWVTPWRTTGKEQILTITLHLLSGTSRDNYVFQVVEDGTKLRIRYHSLKEFCDERILVVDTSCTEKDANGTPTKSFYNKKHAKVAAMRQQIYKKQRGAGAWWEMTVALPFAVEQTLYAEPTHVPAAVVFSRINLGDACNPLTCANIELIKRESTPVVCTTTTTTTWNDVTVSGAKPRP